MYAGPHPRWRGIKKQSTPHPWWAHWETQIHIVYRKTMRGWTLIRLYKPPQRHAITRHYARIWTPKPQDRGGGEGDIEFIIQKPDYDGDSGENAAVESQKWANWPTRATKYGYKCRGVCLKAVMIKSNTAQIEKKSAALEWRLVAMERIYWSDSSQWKKSNRNINHSRTPHHISVK